MICINRREYPGSTPHSAEELRVYASGSDEERAALMDEVGVDLALAINGIVQECGLFSSGGVALAGWSLGNTFTIAAMTAVVSLPPGAKKRLGQELLPARRSIHPRAPSIELPNPDPAKKTTFEDVSSEEMRTITVDFSVGNRYDTVLMQPPFASIVSALVSRALFDPTVQAAWKGTKVYFLYGKRNPWSVVFSTWKIEERVEAAKDSAPITFRTIEGANHFVRPACPDARWNENSRYRQKINHKFTIARELPAFSHTQASSSPRTFQSPQGAPPRFGLALWSSAACSGPNHGNVWKFSDIELIGLDFLHMSGDPTQRGRSA
ncbi:hypothetical protein DFH07DRAFT_785191 [Mycena maculata]|uniref:AB hydrolase-1 domain-containing protein n=1 Tax=Mycena maculata TaxID=230809 RepID=A0AAD7HC58_9AGAR|nr:hypothetical protein DFH07DRAFT_785191 [Mycena maculata]